YFEHFECIWRHGDWATLTERGGVIIHGRSDATLNPGGVRIGTAEIYRQVEAFDEIEEALVVGQDWDNDVRVILFVRMAVDAVLDDELVSAVKARIRSGATPRHVPRHIIAIPDIPRTRSGKITELAVRDVIHGRPVKNTEALANAEALAHFANLPQLAE
ncbi:MAG: acetoacetate--CoA ligase, partial [Pseudomonadota bacterium]|nr:acetoacetate--CoA ligase [Pseudomonadota bacterium]